MIYNDNYTIKNDNLTDGNIGARKKRNIRDNIYVMNAILNSVINGNMEILQYNKIVSQMTRNVWQTVAPVDNKHTLWSRSYISYTQFIKYIENKNAQITIKNYNKLTKRVAVKDVVMQGSVSGSLKCTTTMDQ